MRTILTGGQTGVDRAALDVGAELGVATGGWCPRGRLAEDGRVPERYPLSETPGEAVEQRTEWNVRDADAVVVLGRGPLTGGTALAVDIARRLDTPVLVVDLDAPPAHGEVQRFLAAVEVVNVAGPRESECPGIGAAAAAFLRGALCGSCEERHNG